MKFIKILAVPLLVSFPIIYACNSSETKADAVTSEVSNVQTLGQMPSEITESSGLELADQLNTFYTHSDHGNGTAILFKIDAKGKLLKKISISGADNKDWEDLARDNFGNLYIADIGNNSGNRNDLTIYKVNAGNPTAAEAISMTYDTQAAAESTTKKGKKKGPKSFNCEAVFWHNGSLYLITKSDGKDGTAHLFSLKDSPGKQTALHLGSKDVGDKITSADLSPDGTKLALMSIGRLHVFNVSGTDFFQGEPKTIDLGNVGQTEGMVFTDNKTIIFSNEEGQLFKYSF